MPRPIPPHWTNALPLPPGRAYQARKHAATHDTLLKWAAEFEVGIMVKPDGSTEVIPMPGDGEAQDEAPPTG